MLRLVTLFLHFPTVFHIFQRNRISALPLRKASSSGDHTFRTAGDLITEAAHRREVAICSANGLIHDLPKLFLTVSGKAHLP